MADLTERLRFIENRLECSSSDMVATIDVDSRAKVQEQVAQCMEKLTLELSELSLHKQELLNTENATQNVFNRLDALQYRMDTIEVTTSTTKREIEQLPSRTPKAIQDVLKRLDTFHDRMEMIEVTASTMKRELEQLAPSRTPKVGIAMDDEIDSPLAEVRRRVNALEDQVAELHGHREGIKTCTKASISL